MAELGGPIGVRFENKVDLYRKIEALSVYFLIDEAPAHREGVSAPKVDPHTSASAVVL
jgi:hypothetical protein